MGKLIYDMKMEFNRDEISVEESKVEICWR